MKNFTLILFFFSSILFCPSSKAQLNNALVYAPSDGDYATMPNGIVSSLTGDFTIEAWVYWKGGGNWERIFDFGNSRTEYMYLATSGDDANNSVTFGFKIAGHNERRLIGTPLPLNTWTHIAVTVSYTDPTNPVGNLYINGVRTAINGMRDADLTPYHASDLVSPRKTGWAAPNFLEALSLTRPSMVP